MSPTPNLSERLRGAVDRQRSDLVRQLVMLELPGSGREIIQSFVEEMMARLLAERPSRP